MTTGSKEFYELRDQFERDVKSNNQLPTVRLDREDKSLNRIGHFYCDGMANSLFIGYMMGYTNAKCLANMGAL